MVRRGRGKHFRHHQSLLCLVLTAIGTSRLCAIVGTKIVDIFLPHIFQLVSQFLNKFDGFTNTETKEIHYSLEVT